MIPHTYSHVRFAKKDLVWEVGSHQTKSAGAMISDFVASRTVKNNYCFIRHVISGITATHMEYSSS